MKNKTKKIVKLTFAILLVVLIQSIGITYAKYIASENATGYAEVAKWGFEIIKEGEQMKNIKLVDTTNKDTLVNGKIAPGTSGQILIQVDANKSDVDVDYTLKFMNEKNKPDNLHFTFLGKSYNTLAEIGEFQNIIKHNQERKINDIQVFWEWRYETGITGEEKNVNNIKDTQNANEINEYTFDVVVTATQAQ